MAASDKQNVLARMLGAIRGDSKRLAPAHDHYDGWMNFTTGAGTALDKTRHTFYAPLQPLTDGELEALYYGDDISARAIDDRADEMFRRGYKLEGSQKDDVSAALRLLDVDCRLRDVIGWGDLYGGAGVVMGVDDGQDPREPLNVEASRGIKFLNVVDRRHLHPLTYYSDALSPKFGMPERYTITPAFGGGSGYGATNIEVHESRILVHRATRVDPVAMRRLDGWSYSALQRPYDVIRQFANAYAAAGQLMYDAGQGVLRVSKLIAQLGSPNRQKILERFMMFDQQRWSGRTAIVDKDGEDFTRQPVQVAGIADLLDRFMMRLASAYRMPVTLLMGRSPAGENATGESDLQLWRESVKRDQVAKLEPMLHRLVMIQTAGNWDGKTGESANGIEWIALQEPDDEATEKVEYIRAQRWALYGPGNGGMGALTGEQICAIEFAKKPIEDVVDSEALMKAIKADNELLKNPPKQPPPNAATFTGKPPAPGAPNDGSTSGTQSPAPPAEDARGTPQR